MTELIQSPLRICAWSSSKDCEAGRDLGRPKEAVSPDRRFAGGWVPAAMYSTIVARRSENRFTRCPFGKLPAQPEKMQTRAVV